MALQSFANRVIKMPHLIKILSKTNLQAVQTSHTYNCPHTPIQSEMNNRQREDPSNRYCCLGPFGKPHRDLFALREMTKRQKPERTHVWWPKWKREGLSLSVPPLTTSCKLMSISAKRIYCRLTNSPKPCCSIASYSCKIKRRPIYLWWNVNFNMSQPSLPLIWVTDECN